MEVYLDVLILENLVVNFFLLVLTANTLKIKVYFKSVFFPALAGACYCIVLLFPSLIFFNSIIFKLIVSLLMTFWVFKKKNFIFLIKSTFIYIMYSMLLAGLCIFLDISKNGVSLNPYTTVKFSYKYLFLAIIIIYLTINRIMIYIDDRKTMNKYIYDIEILDNNWSKTIRVFLDTGNELREPVTNLPVIIVEEKNFSDVNLKEKDFYKIPYKVVNGDTGLLNGFKPLGVKIVLDKNNIQFREAIVCICKDRLSSTGDYDGLLSRGLI